MSINLPSLPLNECKINGSGPQPVFNQIRVHCKVLVCFMRLSGVCRGGRGQVFAPGHAQNSRKQLVAMGFYRDISMRSRTMCSYRIFFFFLHFTLRILFHFSLSSC